MTNVTKNILSVFRAEKSGLVKKLAFKTPFGVFESVFKGKLKNSEPKPLKGEETLPATPKGRMSRSSSFMLPRLGRSDPALLTSL